MFPNVPNNSYMQNRLRAADCTPFLTNGPDGPAIIEGNDFPGTDLCQLAPFCPEKTGLWPYYKELLHL